MTELRLDTWTMPGADVGPENPLPPLAPPIDEHASVHLDPEIPEEDQRYVGYGRVSGALPYLMQDGYTRKRAPKAFRTAVLENEVLRATFLLDLGGRLWSLMHKPTGRELLETNPVFQPANLAIRNAWFSGGVEWNVGLVGHCPFTCSPLFAARAERDDGTPVLRLWEYERIRGVPFQIDAYLPDGSPVLYVRVRLVNPHDHTVPMYWWSNIAAPETPETRVLTPADHAYQFGYAGGLGRAPIPLYDGRTDATYSTNIGRSMDFFYRVPDGARPWIAALDAEGKGLGQTSTALLKGRKLFLWGVGPGGKRWQEFLSEPGRAYIEIQAGLARTQTEHLPMPARAEWEWLEAYGYIEADPAVVHGSDWDAARHCVGDAIEGLAAREAVDREFEGSAPMARRAPTEILHRGSGWGALESLRRSAAGEPPLCGPELPFSESDIGDAERPWVDLLRGGELPAADPNEAPRSYLVGAPWLSLLEGAVDRARGAHWAAWLHLGVMRYHAGDREGAREAWKRSRALAESPWALRNLAVVESEAGNHLEAANLLLAAASIRPDLLPLLVECGQALLRADRPAEWRALLNRVRGPLRSAGRILLLEGQAALAEGDLDAVEAILAGAPEIDDMREGEVSLSDLWYGMQERRLARELGVEIDDVLRERVRREFPPPAKIDFRMAT